VLPGHSIAGSVAGVGAGRTCRLRLARGRERRDKRATRRQRTAEDLRRWQRGAALGQHGGGCGCLKGRDALDWKRFLGSGWRLIAGRRTRVVSGTIGLPHLIYDSRPTANLSLRLFKRFFYYQKLSIILSSFIYVRYNVCQTKLCNVNL